jgi:hypothetical protein
MIQDTFMRYTLLLRLTSMPFSKSSRLAIVLTASAVLVACNNSNNSSSSAGPPAQIAATGGSGQSASIGTAFQTPLAATVEDSKNNPVSGASVTFTAPTSGPSGTFGNGKATETETTMSNGVATASFTANSTVGGPYTVTASVSGVSTNVSYTLVNTPAAVVTATSGSGQSTLIDTGFITPLQATVALQGKGVSGVTVTFTAPTSGASGSFAGGSNTATANTDGSGVATAPAFTANGTTGIYQVTATAANSPTPATFEMVNVSTTSSPFPAGNYVFSLSGTDANASFYDVGGVFAVNADGIITGGYQTFADAISTERYEPIPGGALVSASNGNVRILLNTGNTKIGVGGSGEEIFDASLVSSSKALLTEFDTWATASGELDAQSLPSGNTLCSASSCSYAFLTSGKIPGSSTLPFAMGGIFSLNSGNAVSSGVFDSNSDPNGTQNVGQAISGGSSTNFNPFGVFQLTLNVEPVALAVGFDGYVIDSNHIRLVESDGVRVISGVALAQTGTNLSGICTSGSSYVIGLNGVDGKGVLQVAGLFTMPNATAGSAPGGEFNHNDPTATTNQPPVEITGGSCVEDSTFAGRVSLAVTTSGPSPNLQLYVTGNTDGDVLALSLDSTDTSAGHGYQQSGGPFTDADFSGTYALDATGVNNTTSTVTTANEFDAVGSVTANGTGGISASGSIDLNWIFNTGPTAGLSISSGSYAASSNGVFTGTLTGLDAASSSTSDAFSYYLVDNAGTGGSSSRVIAIETDQNQLSLDFLEQQ